MKFSEMPYQRPNLDEIKAQFAAVTQRFAAAPDYAAAKAAFGRAAAAQGAVIFAADSAGHQQSRRKKLDAGNDHQGKMCAQLVPQVGEIEHGVPLVSKKAPHCNAEHAPCAVAGTGASLYTIDILRLSMTFGP